MPIANSWMELYVMGVNIGMSTPNPQFIMVDQFEMTQPPQLPQFTMLEQFEIG